MNNDKPYFLFFIYPSVSQDGYTPFFASLRARYDGGDIEANIAKQCGDRVLCDLVDTLREVILLFSKKGKKTSNTRGLLVVTDPTTSLALTGLLMGKWMGSRVLQRVWPYVVD